MRGYDHVWVAAATARRRRSHLGLPYPARYRFAAGPAAFPFPAALNNIPTHDRREFAGNSPLTIRRAVRSFAGQPESIHHIIMNSQETFKILILGGCLFVAGTGCDTTTPDRSGRNNPIQSTISMPRLLSRLVQQRDEAGFYVRKVREKLPPTSGEAFEAEKLYEQARGSVNGSMTQLQLSLQEGKDPANDPEYSAICEESQHKIQAFTTLAERYTSPEEKAQEKFFPLVPITADFLISLGKSLWGEVSSKRKLAEEQRVKRAKELSDRIETTKWAAFRDVK